MRPYGPLSVYAGVNGPKLLLRPFFALASVLSSASLCWNQVLNFIEEDIAKHQDVPAEETSSALVQVRFNAAVIQRFQGFIQLDLETIRDDLWGVIPVLHDRHGRREGEDRDDTEQNLDREQESASSLLQSTVSLLESQESMRRNQELNKFTKVAFFFVPVSLVSSVFSMNVIEITPD
ncbi:hypothetical protein Hte_007677, partial [Hypoxylon texense]